MCASRQMMANITFILENVKYPKIYFALVIINACCFLKLAYYSDIGTVICMSLYAVLFVQRIINLFRSGKEMLGEIRIRSQL